MQSPDDRGFRNKERTSMLMRVLALTILMTAAVGLAFAAESTPQPLTRADCEKAGMKWNDNANVCGGKEALTKPEAKPAKTKKK
jgi:hypothetical protein